MPKGINSNAPDREKPATSAPITYPNKALSLLPPGVHHGLANNPSHFRLVSH